MSARPRALDISAGVGAAYAGKLLAEFGWDVVKVEAPAGDPLRLRESRWGGGRGGAIQFVNYGKRGVVARDTAQLLALAAAADIVRGDFSPNGIAEAGIPSAAYDMLEPRLATVSVTPFGLTGPRSDWIASDLIVQAASGMMFLTGEWKQSPMQLPPYQGALAGGMAAAAAALAAARQARRDGVRQKVDVSMVEALSTCVYGVQTAYAYYGEVAGRETSFHSGLRMVPTLDGSFFLSYSVAGSMRLEGISTLLNEPRLLDDRFRTVEGRIQNAEEFANLLVSPFQQKTTREWFEAAENLNLTFTLIQTVDDLMACPQLQVRGTLRTVRSPDGREVRIPKPYRVEGWDGVSGRAAPHRPGADTDAVLMEWLAPR